MAMMLTLPLAKETAILISALCLKLFWIAGGCCKQLAIAASQAASKNADRFGGLAMMKATNTARTAGRQLIPQLPQNGTGHD